MAKTKVHKFKTKEEHIAYLLYHEVSLGFSGVGFGHYNAHNDNFLKLEKLRKIGVIK